MTDELKSLLNHLVACKAHKENDRYSRIAYWEAEFERAADEIADLWATETADAHE